MPAEESVRPSSHMHSHPVIVTVTVTMLGLIPLLSATGPGSKVQQPLTIMAIGGLLTYMLLTLVMLPMLCKWSDEESKT